MDTIESYKRFTMVREISDVIYSLLADKSTLTATLGILALSQYTPRLYLIPRQVIVKPLLMPQDPTIYVNSLIRLTVLTRQTLPFQFVR